MNLKNLSAMPETKKLFGDRFGYTIWINRFRMIPVLWQLFNNRWLK